MSVKRVYLDVMIFIYALDNDSPFNKSADAIMRACLTRQVRIVWSLFVLGELLVLPTRLGDEFTGASIRRIFLQGAFSRSEFTARALETYIQVRAMHRTKPLDSVHLAITAATGVDLFITNDTKLIGLAVPGISEVAGMEGALARLQAD